MFCYRILRSCLLLLLTSVAAELARGSELTELVADHVFSDIHRDELVTVVDGNRVADEVGADH